MQISLNEFAGKFQGTLQMDQKVTIRFWWESDYRLHLETISPLFADP